MPSRTVRTSILILSDTHLAQPFPSTSPPPAFPHIDLVLHAGDLTQWGTLSEFRTAFERLASLFAVAGRSIVIPGNHDLGLDRTWLTKGTWEAHWGRWWTERAEELGPSAEGRAKDRQALGSKYADLVSSEVGHLARQVGCEVWIEDGMRQLKLKNGALIKIYASPSTPAFCDYAFAHVLTADVFNPPSYSSPGATNIASRPIPSDAQPDIVLTHGPPKGILDAVIGSGAHVGCPHLLNALHRARPTIVGFGHIHEGYGAGFVRWDATEDSVQKDLDGGVHEIQEVKGQIRGAEGWEVVEVDLAGHGDAMLQEGETLMVNAAIMDVDYRMRNKPWLLWVDLPVHEDPR